MTCKRCTDNYEIEQGGNRSYCPQCVDENHRQIEQTRMLMDEALHM